MAEVREGDIMWYFTRHKDTFDQLAGNVRRLLGQVIKSERRKSVRVTGLVHFKEPGMKSKYTETFFAKRTLVKPDNDHIRKVEQYFTSISKRISGAHNNQEAIDTLVKDKLPFYCGIDVREKCPLIKFGDTIRLTDGGSSLDFALTESEGFHLYLD